MTRRSVAQWPWLLGVTFLVALAVAVALFVVGASHSGDVWFELAKAGIQLFAIVIFGGAVAAAFRSLDSRREDRRRLDEYRAATVEELFDAYHRIKAVRRTLRASGFGKPASGKLSLEQRDEFHAQMKELDGAQLSLEKLKRAVEGQSVLFQPHDAAIKKLIRTAEKYVGHVVDDWEDHGIDIQEGKDLRDVLARLEYLPGFLGRAKDEGGIKVAVSEPVVKAALLIQSLRFRVSLDTGEPSDDPDTSSVLPSVLPN